MPDLFLTKERADGTHFYEIYIQRMSSNNKQLYCLVQRDEMGTSDDLMMIEFADMDRDGMTDMITYDSAKQSIFTYYNKHVANSAAEVNLCKSSATDINTAFIGEANRFFAPFNQSPTTIKDIDVQKLSSSVYASKLPDSVSTPQLPGRLRIGDIDADGFPDIMVTLQTADLKATRTVIFLNKKPDVPVNS